MAKVPQHEYLFELLILETSDVQINDLVFSMHAMILTAFQVFLLFKYANPNKSEENLASWAYYSVIVGWLSVLLMFILSASGAFNWIPFLYYLGAIKLIVTLVKYFPQVWMNWQRKSTQGWSTWMVVFDLTGGMGSFLQQLLLGINAGVWYAQFSNIPKLGLAVISVIYDIFLIFQYFIYYGNSYEEIPEEAPINS